MSESRGMERVGWLKLEEAGVYEMDGDEVGSICWLGG